MNIVGKKHLQGPLFWNAGGIHRNVLEAHADDEVGGPVGEARHSHGSWPRALREQLSYKEPRNGTWTHLEEGHKAKDS